MSWGTHGTVTHQLPSSLEKVCRPIPKYRMPVWMNINLPSFLGLRPHHHLYLLLIYFSSLYVSTVVPSYVILGRRLIAPQCWPGIWRWWITVFFS